MNDSDYQKRVLRETFLKKEASLKRVPGKANVPGFVDEYKQMTGD